MKIAIEIAPHEDGVHCGECRNLNRVGPDISACKLFEVFLYMRRGDRRRDDNCLAAEQEYKELCDENRD